LEEGLRLLIFIHDSAKSCRIREYPVEKDLREEVCLCRGGKRLAEQLVKRGQEAFGGGKMLS
jgi:hypothetical protein